MKLYNAIERLEEIALAYGNELKSIQAAFPKLQIDMQQALAVRTAELNAEGRALSSQEIVRQCAAMRGELEAIVGRHFSAIIAERQRMIELTEIKGALTEIATSAATDAVKAYASDETTGVSAIVRREFAAVVPTTPQPATPNWADVFKGNWSAETTYNRGDIFTFRGGCYLVLQTALGLMPSKQNQTGPDAHYGILSAPGSPGPIGQPFTPATMIGSTASVAGVAGLVPTPAAGTQTKFLRGDGTFVAISGGGDMLAANNLADVVSVASARTNLGLGTSDSPTFSNINTSGVSSQFGAGGTGAANSLVVLAGSSAASYGSQIRFLRDVTNYWTLGHHSGIQGGSSNDLLLYNQIAANESIRVASATGNLKLGAYGAGTLTTDSSGNVTATSDARAKDIIGDFRTGLDAIRKLIPKKYTWKKETGLNTSDINVSLIAQDLIGAGLNEAVSTQRTVPVYETTNEDGKTVSRPKLDESGNMVTKLIASSYTVSDRVVIAALVNCIKELADRVEALESKV